MNNKFFASVLSSFGKRIGIPELCLDEQNQCMLQVNDVVFNLQWTEKTETLLLYAPVGKLDKNCHAEVYRRLLAANCLGAETDGFQLGLEDSLDILMLSGQFTLPAINDNQLEGCIRALVAAASKWTNKVARLTSAQQGKQDARDVFNKEDIPSQCFLRV